MDQRRGERRSQEIFINEWDNRYNRSKSLGQYESISKRKIYSRMPTLKNRCQINEFMHHLKALEELISNSVEDRK